VLPDSYVARNPRTQEGITPLWSRDEGPTNQPHQPSPTSVLRKESVITRVKLTRGSQSHSVVTPTIFHTNARDKPGRDAHSTSHLWVTPPAFNRPLFKSLIAPILSDSEPWAKTCDSRLSWSGVQERYTQIEYEGTKTRVGGCRTRSTV
jgi:hypothetical protein